MGGRLQHSGARAQPAREPARRPDVEQQLVWPRRARARLPPERLRLRGAQRQPARLQLLARLRLPARLRPVRLPFHDARLQPAQLQLVGGRLPPVRLQPSASPRGPLGPMPPDPERLLPREAATTLHEHARGDLTRHEPSSTHRWPSFCRPSRTKHGRRARAARSHGPSARTHGAAASIRISTRSEAHRADVRATSLSPEQPTDQWKGRPAAQPRDLPCQSWLPSRMTLAARSPERPSS